MDRFLQDLRYGLRLFLRAPGVTIPILITLALGIGANTAMFSVIDAVLLHPFNFREPARLALLWEKDPKQQQSLVAGGNFIDFREQSKSFEQLAGWISQSFVLTGSDRPEQVSGATVTANFFATLGVTPTLGRPFLTDEDGLENAASYSRVVILSHRTWQDRFGADINVIGRTIRLNDQQFAVVGVMPSDFQFINPRHAFWVPARFDTTNRNFHNVTAVGRLRAGIGVQAAIEECGSIARRLGEQFPATNRSWGVQMDLLEDWLVRSEFRTSLLILSAAVIMVLLIACGNVANLLLARAAVRRREIALRTAVGASRWRIVRQLLTESVLLSILGGVLGLLLARWLVGLAPQILPAGILPPTAAVRISGAVLWFTAGVSVLTGILFGLAPAIQASKINSQEALRDGSRGMSSGTALANLRSALVVVEVALATILLAGSALMLESFNKLTNVNLGFEPTKVLTFSVFLPVSKYPQPQRVLAFYRRAVEQLRSLPGVDAVTTASHLPLQRMTHNIPFELDTDPVREEGERPAVWCITIDAAFLETLRVPLRDGRGFDARDDASAPPIVVVNEAFAKTYFPNQSATGRFLRLNRMILGKSGFEPTVRTEIVGVIGNVKPSNLSAPAEPIVYIPYAQNVWSPTTMVAMRTRNDPESLIAAVRKEIQSLDKDQPIDRVITAEQRFSDFFAAPKFRTYLMGAFAGLAFFLAILGIYGVNAYAVNQRRQEFGVRMALGATPMQILRMALLTALKQTALGALIGVGGAIALGSVLRSLLFGVAPTDPATLALVAVVLSATALVVGLVPAIRASRVDPAEALRQ